MLLVLVVLHVASTCRIFALLRQASATAPPTSSGPENGVDTPAAISWLRDFHVRVGSAPLKEATTLWHQKMAMQSDVHLKWLDSLRAFAAACDGVCTVGTMYSGSDVVQHALEAHSNFWLHTFGIELRFVFKFAAERNEEKQQFLINHTDVEFVFGDCDDCNETMATDLRTGKKVPIPWVHWLWAGFPCTSKSKANNKRSSNRDCIRSGTEATGEGFVKVRQVAVSLMPSLLTLENVSELAKGTPNQTDADFICQSLSEGGFWAKHFTFDASEYGSKARRERTYWQAVADLIGQCGDLGMFLDRLLVACRLSDQEFQISDFITTDETLLEHHLSAMAADREARERIDPVYKDDHNEFYRAVGLTWPPILRARHASTEFDYRGLTERMCQLVVFLDFLYPVPNEEVNSSGKRYDFADIGQSVTRLIKCKATDSKEWHNPWSIVMPTLTGHSVLAMREAFLDASGGLQVKVRALTGYECMSLVGWHSTFYKDRPLPRQSVLSSLAGNAFSAFACGVFALLGPAAYSYGQTAALASRESGQPAVGEHDGSSADEDLLSESPGSHVSVES